MTDVEKILICFILDTNKYLLWQTMTTQTSHPPTQQAFSDRFWTILIHLYLNKWQCSFSEARERCDERRIVPWENWDWLYEDSKGTDQPTHLYKLVCSYTVGIHENISNWIWKYPSWSDQFALYTGWKLNMTFYHGVAPHVCFRKWPSQRSNIYESAMIFFISI